MTIKQLFTMVEHANKLNTYTGNNKIVVVLEDHHEYTNFTTWLEYKKYIITEYVPQVAEPLLRLTNDHGYYFEYESEDTLFTCKNTYKIYLETR